MEATYQSIADNLLRPKPFWPPKSLDKKVEIYVRHYNGWPVYEIKPFGYVSDQRVIYFHGGAYIHEITPWHWKFIGKLVTSTSAGFIVPIYPLAPIGKASTVVPVATDIVTELLAKYGAGNTSIMGDSAGGGLALTIAMKLRNSKFHPLKQTILISPWLDLSLTDPSIPLIASVDPMLSPVGLNVAAELYRAEIAKTDPMVSPLYGELPGLGEITLFTGTHDILHADAKRLAAQAKRDWHPVNYYEHEKMLHVFPLLPIPEAKAVREIITNLIKT